MSRPFGLLALLSAALTSSACEPELNVGSWPCTTSSGPQGRAPDGSVVPVLDPIASSWDNGFEDGFCGYARAKGFCYASSAASYALVDAPVHSGRRAVRFTVLDQANPDGTQARCVREGKVPDDAVYGAWFFLPATATVNANWNLMFFNGGLEGERAKGAWDVSLGNADDGTLTLHVLNHLTDKPLPQDKTPEVRIGEWFHVEFRWRRAQDTTGAVALYKDDELVAQATGIQTERADVTWQQWYAGNLVGDVTPADSTLYLDDVSIAPPP